MPVSLNDHHSYAIVQIQGIRYDKGEEAVLDDLFNMVPCHSCWEDLTEEIKREPNPMTLRSFADARFLEDAIALDFKAVGDWHDTTYSFFDHEIEMVGIADLVEPYLGDIVESIQRDIETPEPWGSNKRTASILTLWTYHSWADYFGEWDYDISYQGQFQPEALMRMMKDVERTKTSK